MAWVLVGSLIANIAVFMFWMNALDERDAHIDRAKKALDSVKYWQDKHTKLAAVAPWANHKLGQKGA